MKKSWLLCMALATLLLTGCGGEFGIVFTGIRAGYESVDKQELGESQ